MKTKKHFFILFTILMGGFISCSNDEESFQKVEQQVKEVASSLGTNQNLSIFTEAFNGLDPNSIGTTDFTVFAVENEALENQQKSTSNLSQEVLKRHIVKGKYTLEKLKQSTKLVALSGDTLIVEVVENVVRVNGVTLSTFSNVNECVIFIISSIIPAYDNVISNKNISFQVLACNSEWSSENQDEGIPVANATVKIYKENKSLYQTLKTDQNGIARFSAKAGEAYYYTAEYVHDTILFKDTYKGWKVTGLFTSQSQIDSDPQYPASINKIIGGLRLKDINGDGIINDQDKSEYTLFTDYDNNIIEVFIASETFKPLIFESSLSDIAQCIQKYTAARERYITIDKTYSTLEQRQKLTASDELLTRFWNDSYTIITETGRLLDIIDFVFSSESEEKKATYKAVLSLHRAELLFYLVNLFGPVPINTADTSPRNSVNEVYNYIYSDLAFVITNGSTGLAMRGRFVHANVAMLQGNYNEAYNMLKHIFDSGIVSLPASKSATYEIELPVPAINPLVCYLNYSESAGNLGYMNEAITAVNQVIDALRIGAKLPPSATKLQIMTQIQSLYSGNDDEVRYMNISRWGLNSAWNEKYKLLPIPQSATNANPALGQNAGW